MSVFLRPIPILLLAACGGSAVPAAAPATEALPDGAVVLDAATGAAMGSAALYRRLAAADVVLLGELHDNAAHHRVRGALIAAPAPRRPAVVFEQIAESGAPIPAPAPGESREAWLDRHGFDRKGWNWPLHRPVVEAALDHGRSVWGSGVSREALRSVVRSGDSAAPAHLRPLLEAAPLDSAAQDAIDRELVEGHCGQLPAAMIPGMRSAQAVRDAAMTRALLLAVADGPAWLIAGNGHVRRVVAVPRLLRVAAPDRSLLVIGLLERDPDGSLPDAAARTGYDVVIVAPRAVRSDPCASLRAPRSD